MESSLTMLLVTLLAAGPGNAQAPAAGSRADCETRAVGTAGKPLAGAPKALFMKKCAAEAKDEEACRAKAVGKDRKPLVGATRVSFMKDCLSHAR